jgi:site-specific recombinase XerD
MSEGFRSICLAYFGYKHDFGYSSKTDEYVLNNLAGGKISKRSLQKFFKDIIEKAGLPGHYHIHCLRHTYTTFLLTASNHNYRFAQKQLGHSSLRTTQVYAGVVEQQGRKALEKLLPGQ